MKSVSTYRVEIFIAGDLADARRTCRDFCMSVGLCVTVTPTEFIYTGGSETGVCVGLVNYPKYPTTPEEVWSRAQALAEHLRTDLCQHSYLLVSDDTTEWVDARLEAAEGG